MQVNRFSSSGTFVRSSDLIKRPCVEIETTSGKSVGRERMFYFAPSLRGQYLDFQLADRSDYSLVIVEVTVNTPGEHGVTNLTPKISLTNSTALNQFDYLTDPGDQSHLFGRIDQHALFRLGKISSRLKIAIPTINEDYTIAYVISLVVIQYKLNSK